MRYIGTQSGTMPGRPLQEQVDEIVRVYTEKYFPVCQKHNVRILWEPWAGGPNIATGPVAYEALFKAFGDSPYVGLQFDPSHLQWQMMDPVQCARDFADKIYDVHLKDVEILWPVAPQDRHPAARTTRAGGASGCPVPASSTGRASSRRSRRRATRAR